MAEWQRLTMEAVEPINLRALVVEVLGCVVRLEEYEYPDTMTVDGRRNLRLAMFAGVLEWVSFRDETEYEPAAVRLGFRGWARDTFLHPERGYRLEWRHG